MHTSSYEPDKITKFLAVRDRSEVPVNVGLSYYEFAKISYRK